MPRRRYPLRKPTPLSMTWEYCIVVLKCPPSTNFVPWEYLLRVRELPGNQVRGEGQRGRALEDNTQKDVTPYIL